MIFTRLEDAKRYESLGERFAKALKYMRETDLAALPVGRYEIDGTDVFLMIQSADLKPWEDGLWETHVNYADIQMPLTGDECIGFCKDTLLKPTMDYDPARDIRFYEGDEVSHAVLHPGELMILFPEDAHRPCICAAAGPVNIHKAVLKVRL